MPASEVPSFQPIFQVYGTKRKAEENNMDFSAPFEPQDVTFALSKRRCLPNDRLDCMSAVDRYQTQVAMCQESTMEIQHEPPQSAERMPVSRQLDEVMAVHGERVPSPYPSRNLLTSVQHHPSYSNTVAVTPSIHTQETHHIMDLNEETYNTHADSAVRIDGASCMDESSPVGASGIPSSGAMGHTFGCDERGTASMVRCFCRPSWDGCLATKHYVSDYY